MTTIGEVLQKAFTKSPHQHKLAAASLVHAWKTAMPAVVTCRTERVFARDGQLFVQLSSAPLKHTLQLRKDKVLQQLAEQSPYSTIKDIIFL